MSGIGGQEAAGRLVTVQTELPEDIDGILEAIRKIIMLGEVQTLTLKTNEPITYQRFVRHGEEVKPEESTQSYVELTAYEILRNVQMEEWDSEADESVTPHATLVWMFADMAIRGWVVTHLVVGENTRFWEWLNMPPRADQALKQFLGARLERTKELPSEVFILCGAKSKQATITEIGFALKGTTYEQRADTEDN